VSAAERKVAVGLFQEATRQFKQGRLELGLRVAGRSRAAFLRACDTEAACTAACLEARIMARLGRMDEARATLAWAIEHAQGRNLTAREMAVRTDLAVLDEATGDLRSALAAHRAILEQQRSLGNAKGTAVAAANVARLLPRAAPGLTDEARSLLAEALALFVEAKHWEDAAHVLLCLGDLERSEGHLGAAEEVFRAVCFDPAMQARRVVATAALNLGLVLRDRGAFDDATSAFQLAGAAALRHADRPVEARARQALALHLADRVPLPETAAALAEVAQLFRALGQPLGELEAEFNRGGVLCRMGRLREGEAVLAAAPVRLEALGERMGAVEAQLAVAELALAQGKPPPHDLERWLCDDLPHRLRFRGSLLCARYHGRGLALPEMAAALDGAARLATTAAEQWALQLTRAELSIWRGEAPPALAPPGPPSARDRAAVASVATAWQLWRGDLQGATARAGEARHMWREAGEPLAEVHAAALGWRAALLAGDTVPASELATVLPVAAEALDLADTLAGLAALARGELPLLDAAADRLKSRGAGATAFDLWALAARLSGDGDRRGHLVVLARHHDLPLPVWLKVC
jgi:tetratricopeptide (TPR) repeat protein